MKKKSIFNRILLLILLSFFCISLTVLFAFWAGSAKTDLFNLTNLNLSNMIPVFMIGGIISCFIIGIAVLVLSRTVFFKVKDYLSETTQKEKEK
ncbi:MAG: hypothetical protein HFE78_08600 [Clostridiales bacterium]|nr:hypothetical protein [Clostridiales bacterium]